MKQQTAVELLEEKLKISFGNDMKPLRGFFVIAKEMEKQQMIEFAENSLDYLLDNREDLILLTTQDRIEHFYNETYGGNK
jgi:hypothetical protein